MTHLDTIDELSDAINAHPDDDADELHDKMCHITEQIAYKLYLLKPHVKRCASLLQDHFNGTHMNTDFDDQEQIEEFLDTLVYHYAKIKDTFKQGRLIRCYQETKEHEKANELRYARNALAHAGVEPR